MIYMYMGFPSSSDSEESACNTGDRSLIRGSERSSGERNGYPPQYFCLENPMDRGPGGLCTIFYLSIHPPVDI